MPPVEKIYLELDPATDAQDHPGGCRPGSCTICFDQNHMTSTAWTMSLNLGHPEGAGPDAQSRTSK
jgi:hypothetical protein